jgi:hypothetical protein
MSNLIYLFDDTAQKQQWFVRIVKQLSETGFDGGVSPDWSDPTKAQVLSQDAHAVFQALCDERAIGYLVDLKIPVQDQEIGKLRRMLNEHDVWAKTAVNRFDALLNSQDPVFQSNVLRIEYQFALLILTAVHCIGKPAMLVSTLAEGGVRDQIEALNLHTFSYGGFPTWTSPTGTTDDLNTIGEWPKRIAALIDPLERLKVLTDGWFAKDKPDWQDFEKDGIPHNVDAFTEPEWGRYRKYVEEKLSFLTISDNTWISTDERKALHACLKHSFGSFAKWTGTVTADRDICLATVLLLLLLVISRSFPEQISGLVGDLKWTSFLVTEGKPQSFIENSQSHELAAKAVRCIFNLFSSVVTLKDSSNQIGITEIFAPRDNEEYFRIKTAWNSDQITEAFQAFQRDYANRAADCEALCFPSAKFLGNYVKLLLLSQSGENQLGARGGIWLDRKGYLNIGR